LGTHFWHRRLIPPLLFAGEGGPSEARDGWGARPERAPTRPLGKGLAATLPRFAEEG